MDDVVRIYNITVSVLIVLVGTPQLRSILTMGGRPQLAWSSLILFNATAFWGSIESLRGGFPGGVRVYMLAVALTWLLAALLVTPLTTWRDQRRRPKETP